MDGIQANVLFPNMKIMEKIRRLMISDHVIYPAALFGAAFYLTIFGMSFMYPEPGLDVFKYVAVNHSDDGSVSLMKHAYNEHWMGKPLPIAKLSGAFIASFLPDRIGIKRSLMYLSGILIFGWLLMLDPSSLYIVSFGKLFIDTCYGFICVVIPMYAVESAFLSRRGFLVCHFQFYFSFGIFLASFCVNDAYGKSILSIIALVLSVFCALFMLFIPESPLWFLREKRYNEAASTLKYLRGIEDEIRNETVLCGYAEIEEVHLMRNVHHPSFYKPILLSGCLMFFQQFAGFIAVLNFAPLLLDDNTEFNMQSKFVTQSKFYYMPFGTYMMLGNFSFLIVDIWGRKKCLILSALICFFCLNVFSVFLLITEMYPTCKEIIYLNIILVPSVVLYFSGYTFGLGSVSWLLMAEMAPNHSRALVCSIGTSIFFLSEYVIILLINFGYINHGYLSYWFFSFFCLLCCFFTSCLPETKCKSFLEIRKFFCEDEVVRRL